jgi:hypothetical protein
MKWFRAIFAITCFLSPFCDVVFAFSTHNTTISRTFDPAPPIAVVNDSITVTVRFTNSESITVRGFYYTEQIPQGLSINTVSVGIDGNDVSSYTLEYGSSGDVYPSYIPCRWILETPTAFSENNPIGSGVTLEIIYDVTSSQEGTFDFDEFNWVGYYQDGDVGQRAAFGHSEDGDMETIDFILPPMNEPPELDPAPAAPAGGGGGGGGGCFIGTAYRLWFCASKPLKSVP